MQLVVDVVDVVEEWAEWGVRVASSSSIQMMLSLWFQASFVARAAFPWVAAVLVAVRPSRVAVKMAWRVQLEVLVPMASAWLVVFA